MAHHKVVDYESLDYGTYDPCHLLDSVLDRLELRDDAALAAALDVSAALVDDIRHMRKPVDAAMMIRIHELTGLDIDWLRNALGDRRASWRFSEDTD